MPTLLYLEVEDSGSNSTPSMNNNIVESISSIIDIDVDNIDSIDVTKSTLPHVPSSGITYDYIMYSHPPSIDSSSFPYDVTLLTTLTPSMTPLTTLLLYFPSAVPSTVPTSLLLSGLKQSRQLKSVQGYYIVSEPQGKIDLTATGMARSEVTKLNLNLNLNTSQPSEEPSSEEEKKAPDKSKLTAVSLSDLVDDFTMSDLGMLEDEDLLEGVPEAGGG
eukprot:CAMPEP_0182505762 /NCGR_PEP_ID=MMETSP1321-20130603/19856_1 /TAXON_ID=91990 /ORGANISM="Bolidomonas sp., Strain RCC1657" /LENGTH=217 /DNA_ID=CAMNT_0024711365 /DNA_START=132 /DNA_END=782 /DNA_ORIENTATION=+